MIRIAIQTEQLKKCTYQYFIIEADMNLENTSYVKICPGILLVTFRVNVPHVSCIIKFIDIILNKKNLI